MSRNYNLYLQDIEEAADRIALYIEGMTRSAFEADQMRIDAVILNLGIIGEAVKKYRIPSERSIQAFHGIILQG